LRTIRAEVRFRTFRRTKQKDYLEKLGTGTEKRGPGGFSTAMNEHNGLRASNCGRSACGRTAPTFNGKRVWQDPVTLLTPQSCSVRAGRTGVRDRVAIPAPIQSNILHANDTKIKAEHTGEEVYHWLRFSRLNHGTKVPWCCGLSSSGVLTRAHAIVDT
jgi:hypothetical protein